MDSVLFCDRPSIRISTKSSSSRFDRRDSDTNVCVFSRQMLSLFERRNQFIADRVVCVSEVGIHPQRSRNSLKCATRQTKREMCLFEIAIAMQTMQTAENKKVGSGTNIAHRQSNPTATMVLNCGLSDTSRIFNRYDTYVSASENFIPKSSLLKFMRSFLAP